MSHTIQWHDEILRSKLMRTFSGLEVERIALVSGTVCGVLYCIEELLSRRLHRGK